MADTLRNPMAEDSRTENDVDLVRVLPDKPKRKRTITVHEDFALHIIKNHAEAESFISNLP